MSELDDMIKAVQSYRSAIAKRRQNLPAGTEAERSGKRITLQNWLPGSESRAMKGIPWSNTPVATQDSINVGLIPKQKTKLETLKDMADSIKAEKDMRESGLALNIMAGRETTPAESTYAREKNMLPPLEKPEKLPETIADIRKRFGTQLEQPGDKAKIESAQKPMTNHEREEFDKLSKELQSVLLTQANLSKKNTVISEDMLASATPGERLFFEAFLGKTTGEIDPQIKEKLEKLLKRREADLETRMNEIGDTMIDRKNNEKLKGKYKDAVTGEKRFSPKYQKWYQYDGNNWIYIPGDYEY